ncbi:MAG: DUF4410 domain-containing protein [Terrimicrobiaceae bacterium]
MWKSLFAASLCAGLSSCASVTVQNAIPLSQPPPAAKPQKIFVQPFTFDEGTVRVNREGQELTDFKTGLQREMAKNLVERLRKYVANAEVLPANAGVPRGDYWLLTGKFTRVNQGSRFLRSAVGFGSGGTKMDTTVTVSELSGEAPRPLVMIQTTGGSNAMPGAIMGVISWPMIMNGGEGIISGVTGDCRRTSREITAAVAQYCRENSLFVAGDAPKPKPKGLPSWWPEKKGAGREIEESTDGLGQ